MGRTITMDGAGRIVVPKSLRDRFRLRGGARLRIEAVGNHLELFPEAADEDGPAIVRKAGLLVVSASGVPCDAREAIEADREDREDTLLRSQ